MPINFPMYSLNLGSNILEGLKAGQQFKQSRESFPYLLQRQQEQVKQAQAQTPMLQAKTPYAEEMAQFERDLAAQQAPHMAAQTRLGEEQAKYYGPKTEAEIAETYQGTIPYKQAQASAEPMNARGRLLSGLGSYNKSLHEQDPRTQMGRLINSAPMQSLIQTNPQAAKAVAGMLMNNLLRAGGQQGAPQEGQSITDEDIKTMQQNVGNTLFRRTNTAQGINQQRFALTLDNILERGEQLMPSVSQYAGALGKGQRMTDMLKSSFGETSPQFQDYMEFTGTIVPNAVAEMSRALGKNATDQTNKEMLHVLSKDYWDSNPKAAMEDFKRLRNLVQRQISGTISKTPTEIKQELVSASQKAQNLNKPSLNEFLSAARKLNPGVSDQELTAHYQQKYGAK